MKFKPLRDQILVRPVDRLANLGSGLIEVVSDEKDTRGEVVAIGPGMKDEKTGRLLPMDVKVGDRVVYGNGTYLSFPDVKLAGERLLVMREADICWIEETAQRVEKGSTRSRSALKH
jgi:chaperonin GroES